MAGCNNFQRAKKAHENKNVTTTAVSTTGVVAAIFAHKNGKGSVVIFKISPIPFIIKK